MARVSVRYEKYITAGCIVFAWVYSAFIYLTATAPNLHFDPWLIYPLCVPAVLPFLIYSFIKRDRRAAEAAATPREVGGSSTLR
jgi:hypothetical protein